MRFRSRTLIGLFSLIASVLATGALNAQARPAAIEPMSVHASSRIAAQVDDRSLQVLRGNRHPLAQPQYDVGAVSPNLPMQSMVLVLQPSADQSAALEALVEAQKDPSSPYYRQWLTPEQFAEHFGASEADVQTISAWLQHHGMHVDEVASSRRTITFSGTAAQVEQTFATSMRQYKVNGALHIANATEPSIPSALAPVVNGVLSLHDFPVHANNSPIHTPGAQVTYGSSHYVTPGDLAIIYDVNPLYSQGIDGSGQSIAVVARSNINLSDVRTFHSTYGLPANDPQVIVNGTDPGTSNSSELTEATLDAEYAGALARKATVKFVTTASTSTSDGTYLSAQYIVNQNLAPIMTMSFGLCEAYMGASGNAYINSLWQQAASQGITVLVSAGDSGAAGCDSASSSKSQYGLAVNGLCSTPYDLCIGGTQFNDTANPSLYWSSSNTSTTNASALSYIPEAVWNESTSGLWAGGGGSSTLYAKPAWQTGTGVPSDGKRDVPDISLSAAGHDGYIVVMNGSTYVVGGTSAASPALASILALVVQNTGARLGAANTKLYALANQASTASSFHDVTTGSNSVPGLTGYSAATGYDRATGLGSVDAAVLVSNWHSTATTPAIQATVSASSITVAPSATSSLTVKIASSGGFNAAVTLAATNLPKGITATFTPASIAAPGSGTSALQVVVASTVATGNYTFNVVATSGSLSSTAAVSVSVLAPAFTLTASDSSLSLISPTSRTLTLTTAGNAVFNSAVALKVTGVPTGVTATFAFSTIAAPGSGTASLTFTPSALAVPGSYVATITATAGTLTQTVPVTLNLPSLTATTNASTLTVARGASGSLVLTTKIAGGFSSAAAIAVSGLPSGVTATLSPSSIASPGAGTATISLAATASATLGAAKVTVTISGGGLSATVPLTLTIAPQPTFTFTSPSSSATVTAGGSTTVQFNSAAQNGFTSPLTLTASGAPVGVTLKFSASTIAVGQGATLTISAASSATASGTIIVTASGGGLSNSVSIPLTVKPLPTFTFTAASSTATVTAGSSTTVQLTSAAQNGFTSPLTLTATGAPAGVTLKLSSSTISVGQGATLTITATSASASASGTIIVTAAGGGISNSVSIPLTVKPLGTFTFTAASPTATITPGGSATILFTSAAQNGFTSPLTLTATGAPAGVTLKLTSSTISVGQGVTLTITAASSGASASGTIIVTATGGGTSKSVSIPLVVKPQGTFTFAPTTNAPGPTGGIVIQFTSAAQNGFTAPLTLTATGAPAGVTLKLSASTISAGQGFSLTITPTKSVTGTIVVTATGGGQTQSVNIGINITVATAKK